MKPVLLLNRSKVGILVELRNRRDVLAKELEVLNEQVKALDDEVIAYLESGGNPLQDYYLSIEVTTRVIPKWKVEFVKALGEAAAKAVQDRTPPTTYKKLIITSRR